MVNADSHREDTERSKIEPEIYSLKVDDKIEVSVDGRHWYKRYLSRIEDNEVYVFEFGATSWSTSNEIKWKYARIPREE